MRIFFTILFIYSCQAKESNGQEPDRVSIHLILMWGQPPFLADIHECMSYGGLTPTSSSHSFFTLPHQSQQWPPGPCSQSSSMLIYQQHVPQDYSLATKPCFHLLSWVLLFLLLHLLFFLLLSFRRLYVFSSLITAASLLIPACSFFAGS